MDVRDRIRNLIDEVPPLPAGDPDATFRAGRRRVRRRRAVAAGGTAAVAAVAVALVVALPGGDTSSPTIADAPETGDDVQVPAGWETITAGDIAISVPAEWEIARRFEEIEVPDGAAMGGPCLYDLHRPQGLGDEPQPEAPVAVVYDRPTAGACRAVGFDGPPPQPGLVLSDTRLGTVDGVDDQPGAERVGIEERAERARVGALEVWRTVDDEPGRDREPSGIATYIPVDLRGGLWVSHPDDPIVQRILATLRPAPGAERREIEPVTAHRDLPDDAWEVLGTGTNDERRSRGWVLDSQAELDDLWDRIGDGSEAPQLPEDTIAIAGTTYAGGRPGYCHEHREVVGVRLFGRTGHLLMGAPDPERDGPCGDDPGVPVVAVPRDVADGLTGVVTVTVRDG